MRPAKRGGGGPPTTTGKVHLRVVVVSPSDTMPERSAAERVVDSLNRHVAPGLGYRLDTYLWENEAYPAFHPMGYQRGVLDPVLRIAEADMVLAIFWKRFGTPSVGGKTGTEHELDTALEAQRRAHKRLNKAFLLPHVAVYRNQQPLRSHDHSSVDAAEQLLALNRYLARKEKQGLVIGLYTGPREFEKRLHRDLSNFLEELRTRKAATPPRLPSRPKTSALNDLAHTLGKCVFGREREFAELDRAWGAGKGRVRVLVLVAWGGVGKSTVVREWLERLKRKGWAGAQQLLIHSFYDRGASDRVASADEFFDRAFRELGAGDVPPESPWERGRRLAALVASRPTILVLDGFESMQSTLDFEVGRIHDPGLATLIAEIARAGSSLCIITTRQRIADLAFASFSTSVNQLDLEQLSPKAGRDLLRKAGRIAGTDAALEQTAVEFGNHALALSLLAVYLRNRPDPSTKWVLGIPNLGIADREGRHPRRVMAALGKSLPAQERQLLQMLGLFDRPVELALVQAVVGQRPFPSLSSDLVGRNLGPIVARLRSLSLLAPPRQANPKLLDTHPLVRLHFGQQLRRDHEAWKEGHRRAFEYLKASSRTQPETLQQMAPVYQAIAHGCQAGRARAAYELFSERINRQRGAPFFAFWVLNAIGADLAALWWFFDSTHQRLNGDLPLCQRAEILQHVGHCLRALGEFSACLDFLERSARCYETDKNAGGAAVVSGNLARALTMAGDMKQALYWAERAVGHARQRGGFKSAFERRRVQMQANSAMGAVLHNMGELEEAERYFVMAAKAQVEVHRMQHWRPRFLYRVQGFQYCELLIDKGDHQRALELAKRGLERAEQDKVAIDNGRARVVMARAMAGLNPPGLPGQIQALLNLAVNDLRQARTLHELHVALLARADHAASHGDARTARSDLKEADEFATQTGMLGVKLDCLVQYAQLRLACGRHAEAREYLDQAAVLIECTGCRRHQPRIAHLEQEWQRSKPTR